MPNTAFFDEVHRWDWPPFGLQLPLFFPALSSIGALYTAQAVEVSRLLPERRMRPVEVMPGRCLVTFSAIEYRDSDLGPYNELSIAIPIAFGDAALPAFDALRYGLGRTINAYVWQLPVTTERARDVGVELAGYPKLLADVAFRRDGPRVHCSLDVRGEHVLTLSCDAVDAPAERRLKLRSYTMKNGFPLVSTFVVEQQRYRDHLQRDAARLELGHGPLADTLRQLGLSDRPLASQCCSQARAMLFFPRNVLDE